MKDFSKATLRPWKQNYVGSFIETIGRTKNICEMSVNENNPNFSFDEYKQNGELIVTAVNNFDNLSKFLRMVNDCLNDGIPIEPNDPIHSVAKQLLESLEKD